MREYQDAVFERRSGRHCKGVPGGQRLGSVSHFTVARHAEEQVRGRVLASPKYRMRSQPILPRGERGPDVTFLSEDGHVLNYGTYKDTTSLYN